MSNLSKKQKIIQEKLDTEKSYTLDEAMSIIQSVKSEKFDESLDISIKLGVDPDKETKDQVLILFHPIDLESGKHRLEGDCENRGLFNSYELC